MPRFQFRRGIKSALPTNGMLPGEPLFSTDRGTLHIATGTTTRFPAVPALEDLPTAGSINGAADLVMIHDADATGQKERTVTFDAFKTALNIPAGSSDERVAVVAGGTAGFIWGTDGNNGILRMNSSMEMTKDAGNAFVTLAVGTVDGGNF